MTHISRVLAGLAAGVVVVLGTAGCTGGSPESEQSGTLTIVSSAAPLSFSPGDAANGPTIVYQTLAYEPLVGVDENGDLVPALATDWSYIDGSNKTQFTLTIRSDALFADGTPVTTDAIAASLTWFFTNATGPSAGSYIGWTAVASDDSTVLITTPTPVPIVPELLTSNYLAGGIISPAGLADPTQLASATFGAGPYVYDPEQSVSGDHYTYVRNDDYYAADDVQFDEVVVRVIANNTSALSALKSGQVDAMLGDPSIVDSAKSSGLSVATASVGVASVFLTDWEGKVQPALADVRVRQALNYALDRDAIATAIYGDYASADSQPNVAGWDAFDPTLEGTYAYDPERAKHLLAEAGFADGFSFDVVYVTFDPNLTKTVQAVAQQLSEVGVTMNLVATNNFGEFAGTLYSGQQSGFSIPWGGQTQYSNTSQLWLAASPVNPMKNAAVTGLDDAFSAYAVADDVDRPTLGAAVEKIIVDQALTIPVAAVDSIVLFDAELSGVAILPNGNLSNPAFWSTEQ